MDPGQSEYQWGEAKGSVAARQRGKTALSPASASARAHISAPVFSHALVTVVSACLISLTDFVAENFRRRALFFGKSY